MEHRGLHEGSPKQEAMIEIVFHCPHCGKHLKASTQKAGHDATCPACHARLRVPPSNEPPLAPAAAHEQRIRGLPRPDWNPTQPPPAQRGTIGKSAWKQLAIVVVILTGLLLLGVALVAGLWWMKRPPAEDTRQASNPKSQTKTEAPSASGARPAAANATAAKSSSRQTSEPQLDLVSLAKKARPAVMLLVLSDASGKETSSGTGFIVSSDGILVTNYHVIEGATSAIAKSENGAVFIVDGVLGTDAKNDLAVLKLRARDLPFLTLADSARVEPGQRVAVIGSPQGLEGTLSEGIVSAVRNLEEEGRRIQITAAISPGSSGSPVLNEKGEVVGVATAFLRGGQALNFATPSEAAVKLLNTRSKKLLPFAQAASASGEADAEFLRSNEYRAALEAEHAEDWVEMLKAAQALAARFPNRAGTHRCLGRAYAQLGLLDDAVRALRQAIKLKPDYVEAWTCLGFAHTKQRRWPDATDAYKEAVKLKPGNAKNHTMLGACYLQRSMPNEAVAALNHALKLDENDPTAWFALGSAYFLQTKYTDAINALQQSIKLSPDSPESWRMLGLACWSSNRRTQALDALRQLRRLNPAKAAELEEVFSR